MSRAAAQTRDGFFTNSERSRRHRQPLAGRLDPILDQSIDLGRAFPLGLDYRSDDHVDNARFFLEPAARPKHPGVVRDRHDRNPGLGGEIGSANFIAYPLAWGHARTFRENGDP